MKHLKFIIFFYSLFLWNVVFAGGELNTFKITETSMTGLSNCLHYTVKGLCFWYKCNLSGCGVKPTLRLEHYLPDVVITVADRYQNNPWDFANTVIDPLAEKGGQVQIQNISGISMGYGSEGSRGVTDIDNRYKEVDIIGNPGILFFSNLHEFFLRSTAIPFTPYYTSLLDAYAWRYLGLEKFYPGAMIPGIHEIGQILINDWGPLFPRNGFIVQPNDAKASAVLALRAANIITQIEQPHLYNPLSSDCGEHCRATIAKENSGDVLFQMIYPETSDQCIKFGENDATAITPWGAKATLNGKGNYVWIMWRRYEGCIQSDGIYLGQV